MLDGFEPRTQEVRFYGDHGKADGGVEFVDTAVGRDPGVILRHTPSTEQARIASVTTSCVDSSHNHQSDLKLAYLNRVSLRNVCAFSRSLDLSAAMVEAARRLHPDVAFEQRDVLADPPLEHYDVVLCSGLFHVRREIPDDDWWRFMQEMIRRMFELCRVGIAFNAMTDQVDFRSPDLYYADPSRVFEFCRRDLSRHTTLRHDYPLHEFSIYVLREPRRG